MTVPPQLPPRQRRRPQDAGARRTAPHAWERSVVGWHAVFWVVLALSATALVAGGEVTGPQVWWGLALHAVVGLSYAVLGAPAATTRSQVRALAYVASLVLLVPALLWVSDGVSFLLFLAYPQIWLLVDGRARAAAATVAVSAATLVALLLTGDGSLGERRGAVVAVVLSTVFSLALGLWISSVIGQSAQRADLIAELDRTRDELAAAERATGAAQARARVAADIHDTLAQGFTSLVMLSQVARREVGTVSEEQLRERLRTMEDVARANLAEARALVAAFAPVEVHGGDLAAALRRLGERFARETGTAVEVEVAPDVPAALGPDTAVVLLRSAQEGLANVRKHAGAGRTLLRLSRPSPTGPVRLEVADDGVGPQEPAAAATAGGFGIEGLRRRAGEVGGRVALARGDDGGTTLAVEVPAR